MASRYWVGGTDNWNTTAGSKWATTSGGAGGAANPTAADDVFFDAASGAAVVTIASNPVVCRSINCTGYTGSLVMNGSTGLNIGDGTAGAGNIALKFVAGMTFTKNSNTSAIITFVSTSATQQTIDFGGKEAGAVIWNGATGSWVLAANLTANNSSPLTLVSGSLDTANFSINCLSFTASGTFTRSLTIGSSAITCNGSIGSWNIATSTNLTFSQSGSTITLNSGNAVFNGGAFNYGTVVLNPSGGAITISNTGTIANLTIAGTSSGRTQLGQDLTVSGTMTFASSSSTNMSFVLSSVTGVQRTITAAVFSGTNHNFQDINAAGASAPWSATSNIGNAGGNSNITFSSPVTRYWVGNGGNWNSTTKWSASSGGASGASIPLCHDTAVFDSQSITSASQTITINTQVIPGLDFANVLNSPTIGITITNGNVYTTGSMAYKAGLGTSGGTVVMFIGRSAHTLTTGGVAIVSPLQVNTFGGSLTLLDNYTSGSASSAFTHLSGTLSANNFNVSVPFFNSNGTLVRTLNMGNGSWTLSGSGTIWNTTTSTNLTLNQNGSTILVTDTSASSKTFAGGGKTFNNLTITGGGAGAVIFTGASNVFNVFTVGFPKTLTFPSSATTSFTQFLATGTSGNLITINASTGGSRHTLSQASGIVSGDYLSITDSNATGGAYWAAGNNSTNGGNNLGWIFGAATFSKTIAESVYVGNAVSKSVGKGIANTVSLTEAISRAITKNLAHSVYVSEALGKNIGKLVANSVYAGDAISKSIGKNIEHDIFVDEAFSRTVQYVRVFSETVRVNEAVAKDIGKLITNTVYVHEDFTAAPFQPFNGPIITLRSKADAVPLNHY